MFEHTVAKNRLADGALMIAVAIWGSTFFLIKDHLDHVDAVGMLFYRFLPAALILGVYLKIKRLPLWVGWRQGLVVGFWLWGIYMPQNIGMLYTSATNSGFITALFVLFTPVFSVFYFRKMPAVPRLFAAIISFAGIWLFSGGFSNLNQGDLITLISPIAVSFFVLFNDRALKGGALPARLVFQCFVVCSVLSLGWMVVNGSSFAVTNMTTWWVIAYLSAFATLLTFVVNSFVQQVASPMKVALMYALEPVFAALFAYWFGAEHISTQQAAGGALIVLAMVISELTTDRLKRVGRVVGFKKNAKEQHVTANNQS